MEQCNIEIDATITPSCRYSTIKRANLSDAMLIKRVLTSRHHFLDPHEVLIRAKLAKLGCVCYSMDLDAVSFTDNNSRALPVG